MNLLSKEDAEDSIIRIADIEVAAELFEGSFHKGANLETFALPVTEIISNDSELSFHKPAHI